MYLALEAQHPREVGGCSYEDSLVSHEALIFTDHSEVGSRIIERIISGGDVPVKIFAGRFRLRYLGCRINSRRVDLVLLGVERDKLSAHFVS